MSDFIVSVMPFIIKNLFGMDKGDAPNIKGKTTHVKNPINAKDKK